MLATILYYVVPGFFIVSTIVVILDQLVREPYGIFLASKQLDKGWTLISPPTALIPTMFSMFLKVAAVLVIIYTLVKVVAEGGVERLFGNVFGGEKQKPRVE